MSPRIQIIIGLFSARDKIWLHHKATRESQSYAAPTVNVVLENRPNQISNHGALIHAPLVADPSNEVMNSIFPFGRAGHKDELWIYIIFRKPCLNLYHPGDLSIVFTSSPTHLQRISSLIVTLVASTLKGDVFSAPPSRP